MMTDPVQIPSYVDLMYPTLRALVELGDQSDHATIDEKVIELTGITSEQLAVEFPESSVQHSQGYSDLRGPIPSIRAPCEPIPVDRRDRAVASPCCRLSFHSG